MFQLLKNPAVVLESSFLVYSKMLIFKGLGAFFEAKGIFM